MTLTRRHLLAATGAAALPGLTVTSALAQPKAEFTLKYANNLPVTHPMNIRAKEMADHLRQEKIGF